MRICTIFLIGLVILSGCKRFVYRHDTKFRNQLAGNYIIDSVAYHSPNIDQSNGSITDTNYVILPHPDDFFQILATKDQINKNVINTGKFLDSVFNYEIQAFTDDKDGHLSILPCSGCHLSQPMKHLTGVHYVVFKDDKRLNLESRFFMNDSLYTSTIYLRKKQ